MKYNIVGIYELSIEASDIEEAMKKMMNIKLGQCENIYVSDYDNE